MQECAIGMTADIQCACKQDETYVLLEQGQACTLTTVPRCELNQFFDADQKQCLSCVSSSCLSSCSSSTTEGVICADCSENRVLENGKCIPANCSLLQGSICLRCNQNYTINDAFECIQVGTTTPDIPEEPVKKSGTEVVFISLFCVTLVAFAGLLGYMIIMKFRTVKRDVVVEIPACSVE